MVFNMIQLKFKNTGCLFFLFVGVASRSELISKGTGYIFVLEEDLWARKIKFQRDLLDVQSNRNKT